MAFIRDVQQYWKQLCYSLIAGIQLIMVGLSVTWSTAVYEHISTNHTKRFIFNNNETDTVPGFNSQQIALLFGLPQFTVTFYFLILLFIRISPKVKIVIFSNSFVIFWIIMFFGDQTYHVFLIARIIAGIGFLNVLEVNLYIEEISEERFRGALITLGDCSMNIGIMIGFIFGSCLTFKQFSLMAMILSSIVWILSLMLPESPIWSMMNDKEFNARKSLKKLRYSKQNIEKELSHIHIYLQDKKHLSFKELGQFLLRKRQYRHSFFVVILLFMFQQTSGVSITQNYAVIILRRMNDITGEFTTLLITGIGGLICSFMASFLTDNVGRRPLIMSSFVIVIICLFSLSAYAFFESNLSLLPKIAIPLHIGALNAGLGPMPYIIMAEILPINIRRVGSILGILILCLTNSITLTTFSTLCDLIGESFVFIIYTFINIIGLIFAWCFVPETKKIPRHLMQETLYLRSEDKYTNDDEID